VSRTVSRCEPVAAPSGTVSEIQKTPFDFGPTCAVISGNSGSGHMPGMWPMPSSSSAGVYVLRLRSGTNPTRRTWTFQPSGAPLTSQRMRTEFVLRLPKHTWNDDLWLRADSSLRGSAPPAADVG
jgi:hypothetical protein